MLILENQIYCALLFHLGIEYGPLLSPLLLPLFSEVEEIKVSQSK